MDAVAVDQEEFSRTKMMGAILDDLSKIPPVYISEFNIIMQMLPVGKDRLDRVCGKARNFFAAPVLRHQRLPGNVMEPVCRKRSDRVDHSILLGRLQIDLVKHLFALFNDTAIVPDFKNRIQAPSEEASDGA